MGMNKPEELWDKQFDKLFQQKEPQEVETMLDVVGLIVHSGKNQQMSKLYSRVGLKAFTEVIEAFGGQTVTFIEKEELRDTLMLAMCYYYREVKGYDWPKVRELMPWDINTVSMGIRIRNMSNKIRKEIDNLLEGIDG